MKTKTQHTKTYRMQEKQSGELIAINGYIKEKQERSQNQ